MNASQKNAKSAVHYEQQILDTSSIGVLITRIGDGTILYANKAITGLLGIADSDSVIGKPVPNFYWDPEDRKALLIRFRAEGSITDSETRARRADGSMRWVSVSLQHFNFEGESVLLSEITDISAHKQAEEALHASEERFHSIYDNATIGLYRTTPDGHILMINPTGLRLLGFDSFDEMSQRNLEESGFEQKDARKKFREKLESEGVISDLESEWTRKDGSTIYVREGAKLFRNKDGEVLYYDGSFEDITERKQAEAALRESEDRFRRFTEATVEGLVFHEQGKIIDANPAGLTMFGLLDNAEFIGRNLLEFITPESHQMVLQQMKLETVLPYEIQCVRDDGSTFPVETSTRTYKEGGRVIRASSIRDITERKQAEEVLRQTRTLYQSLVEVSPMSICRKDLAGRFTFANRRFLESSQTTLADLVGKTDFDLHPSELADKYRRDDLAVMDSGKTEELIEERAVYDGESSYVETVKTPIYDEDGKVNGIQISFWDITARKRAEEEMRRLQNAMEQTGDGVALADLNGNVLYTNPAWAKMHGYTVEEILGKHLSIFHTPEQLEKEVAPFNEKAMATGGNTGEISHARKDGTTFPTLMTVAVQKNDKDQPVGLIGTIRDITENKRVEQELQENQKFLTLVLDTMPGFLFWKDRNSIYLGSNKVFAKGAGLNDPSEIVGKGDHELAWTKEEADAYIKDDRDVMESDKPKYHIIEPQLQASGKQTWVDTTKIPLHDDHGNVIGILGTFEDITERKQAEMALRESQTRFQNLVETLGEWVWEVDNKGTYTYISPNIKNLLGYEPEEVLGKTPFDLMPSDEAQRVAGVFGPLLSTQQPLVGLENTNRRKDGSLVVLETNGVPFFDANGQILGYRGTDRDITERKRLEREIQESFERRGYQVQISTEISQEIASATELSDLFSRVVTLTKERLGYYHTQLLRYDTTQDAVVLINGYGETGQKMLEGGHKMPMGSGLIGTAAESGQTVLRPTLAADPDWRPNPLLPDTQGEIAVPIKLGDQILGVLDVQSDQAGALTEDDRLLLEGLCGQIAIAMQSAELVKTIRENEANLSEALRTARLANWEYDVEKDLFTFNDEFYSIFHSTAEKAGGYQISSARYAELFVHPDDIHLVGAEIGKSLISTERVYNTTIDHRIKYEDGGIGYITVKVTVERDENGKITRYYGANQDITERKLAEEALRHSEQLMRTVIDSTPDWIFIKDQDHRYQLANKGYADALHIAPEDFIGKNDLDLGFPEDLVKGNLEEGIRGFWADDLLVMDRNETQVYPDDPATIDGVVHNFHTIKVPLRNANGKAWGVLAFSRDITERKLAEMALRESELRYQQILDAITDMILVKGEKSSITWANKAFREYYGMTNEQLLDMIDAPIVEPDYTLQYIKDDAQVFESGKVLVIPEEPVTRYDGTVHPFETFKAPIRDLNGNVVMTVGVSRDITERLKEKQAMAERLEEINRLYQNLSREGWKTYRETANLPKGFMFDQTGTQPVEDMTLTDENFAQVSMKVMGGEVVGNLAVANDPLRPMSEDDLTFLQQVSDQVALALEGARLSAQTQSALAQSEILFEASRRLAQVSDLQELVKTTVETFNIPVINGAELDMFSYDSEGELESLSVVANWWNGTGTAPGVIGSRFSKEMFSAVKLFLTSTPVFISDALDSDRVDAGMLRIVKTFNIRAVTFMPLFVGIHQIGVLVMHAEEPHNFTEEETRLFSGLAPQIATVLDNRRQFERAQQQADRETTLNVISQKIQSATTVEAVLQIAARELGHALGAPMTIAQLSMKDKT